MKNLKCLLTCLLLTVSLSLSAQSEFKLADYSFTVNDLNDPLFEALMNKKLQNSRFVFVGEQHGIKSAATVTSKLYDLGQSFGYNTLCVETDDVVAQKLRAFAAGGNFTASMKAHYKQFPFTIPFYNNEDDHVLFDNVYAKGGDFWGIDQTFIVQFRLNFAELAQMTSNRQMKRKLKTLQEAAEAAYAKALETKNPKGPYLFTYDKATHKELLSMAGSEAEKEIIRQLWNTKEIYEYFFSRKNFQNNNVRGNLMKANFMRYYNQARTNGKDPKVVFKLGANHAARGLTRTNIYDIANLGSELAISQGEHSVHVAVMGLKGKTATGNPFAPSPIVEFDNTDQLAEELQKEVEGIGQKYYVIDLEALKDYAYSKRFSEKFKESIFKYDVLILVNGAEAVRSFQ